MKPAAIPLDPKNLSLLWASPERADEIAALHARLFDPPWDAESITRSIEHPASVGFHGPDTRAARSGRLRHRPHRCRRGGDPVDRRRARMAAAWHRPADGRGLVRAARRAEVKRLFLEVAADNDAAIALYEGLGFKIAGARKAYYQRAGGVKSTPSSSRSVYKSTKLAGRSGSRWTAGAHFHIKRSSSEAERRRRMAD